MKLAIIILSIFVLMMIYNETKDIKFNISEKKATKDHQIILENRICIRDVKIKQGPNFEKDDPSGKLLKGENVFVLQSIGEWIKFRVTKNDIGWSGWIQRKNTKEKKIQKKIVYCKYEEDIATFITTGFITKINIDYNQIYVDTRIWNGLTFQQKETLGMKVATYFGCKGSTSRVTIYNGFTGKKIAKYSSSWGFKIY